MTGSEDDRRRWIYQNWKRSGFSLEKVSFEKISVSLEIMIVFGFLFLLLVSPIDNALWPLKEKFFQIGLFPRVNGWCLLAMASICCLLNWGLWRQALANRTPDEEGFRPAVLLLRGILVAIPVFGLIAGPLAWSWFVKRRPSWARRRDRRRPSLLLNGSLHDDPFARSDRGSLSKRALLGVIGANSLYLGALNQWLSEKGSSPPVKAYFLASTGLHLAAFACVLSFLAQNAHAQKRTGRKLLAALLWLLPLPNLPILGIFALSLVTAETQRSQTLTNNILSRQRGLDRLSLGRSLRLASRAAWTRAFPRRGPKNPHLPPGRARSRLLALSDIKASAVLLNVAAFSWWLDFKTRSSPALAFIAQGLLGLMILAALVLAVASLAAGMLLLVYRRRSPPSVWKDTFLFRSFALLSAALFLGTLQGLLWNRGEFPASNSLVLWPVCGYFSYKTLRLARFLLPRESSPGEELPDHLLRLLFTIGVIGSLTTLSASAHAGRTGFVTFFWLLYVLVCEVLPGALRLPWLLRPYQVRDIFSSALPAGRKATLTFLALTTVAPCGGLAAPLWALWEHSLGQCPAREARNSEDAQASMLK